MNDLVEKMLDAYMSGSNWPGGASEQMRTGMTAAATVLLEAALGDVTENEYAEWPRMDRPTECWYDLSDTQRVDVLLANRKARLLAPKTIESRVAEHLDAFLPLETFQARDNAIKQLARELVGLIAEMKEKG